MRIEEIRRLINLVQGSDVDEIEVTRWLVNRIRVTRRAPRPVLDNQAQTYVVPPIAAAPAPAQPGPAAEPALPTAPIPELAAEPVSPPTEENLVSLTSPMVGTFYIAPAPGAEPFAQIGDRVAKGKTVCIIEAMKIMNEIEAECAGEIVERLVENGDPVEFGQVLFKIRPA